MGIGEPSHRVAGLAGQLGDAENRLRIRRRRVSRKARDEAAERLLGACEPLVGGGFGGLHRGDQLGGRRLGLRRLCPFVERGSLRCLVGFGQGADGLGGQLARVGGVAPFRDEPCDLLGQRLLALDGLAADLAASLLRDDGRLDVLCSDAFERWVLASPLLDRDAEGSGSIWA